MRGARLLLWTLSAHRRNRSPQYMLLHVSSCTSAESLMLPVKAESTISTVLKRHHFNSPLTAHFKIRWRYYFADNSLQRPITAMIFVRTQSYLPRAVVRPRNGRASPGMAGRGRGRLGCRGRLRVPVLAGQHLCILGHIWRCCRTPLLPLPPQIRL